MASLSELLPAKDLIRREFNMTKSEGLRVANMAKRVTR